MNFIKILSPIIIISVLLLPFHSYHYLIEIAIVLTIIIAYSILFLNFSLSNFRGFMRRSTDFILVKRKIQILNLSFLPIILIMSRWVFFTSMKEDSPFEFYSSTFVITYFLLLIRVRVEEIVHEKSEISIDVKNGF